MRGVARQIPGHGEGDAAARRYRDHRASSISPPLGMASRQNSAPPRVGRGSSASKFIFLLETDSP